MSVIIIMMKRECTVKSWVGSFLIAALTLSLVLIDAAQTPAESNQPVAPQSDSQEDQSLPIYTPPKKLTPRARVGGQMRGTEGSDPEIQALVPDHVGLTVSQTPVLNWFLSKPTAYTVHFTLVDNRLIKPVYEAPLPPPKEAGIQAINLKALGLSLEPDVQYRWYVSMVRNPDSPSQDIVAGGVIERCDLNVCLVEAAPDLSCNQQSVMKNARSGFWYDAMACLCDLIKASPADLQLRRQRAALLKQVGLHGVAEWDLRSAQALSH
jgi:hypothetical protein